MILSDKTILKALKAKEIIIKPFIRKNLQPASVDLTLGGEFKVFNKNKIFMIDPKEDIKDKMITINKKKGEYFVLHPGNFVLSVLNEETGVDDKHVARLEGKSSLARLGLFVHATAGFLDPGNSLKMTLELYNAGGLPIKLYAGMKVAQIAFEELTEPCLNPYGSKKLNSKYYKSKFAEESKYHLNFKK